MTEIRLYNDQLTDEELQFLIRKDEKESRNFFKVIQWVMIICFIVPFGTAWLRALDGAENPFSAVVYFASVAFLLCFSGGSAWIAYSRSLQKIKEDIKRKAKTVERVQITRKQHVLHGNTYYFYIDSQVKLSIEVAEGDYYMLNEGDELNIEYSTNSKLYFGYF